MEKKIKMHKEVRNMPEREDHIKRLHLRSVEISRFLADQHISSECLTVSVPKEILHSILTELSSYSSDLGKVGRDSLSILIIKLYNDILGDMEHVRADGIIEIGADKIYSASCVLSTYSAFLRDPNNDLTF